ncbi:hypothetical protein [Paenibacillus segetis]|nr:hypothetical protein [Paenibacillus segetis]
MNLYRNLDVMSANYIIDMGPEGEKHHIPEDLFVRCFESVIM